MEAENLWGLVFAATAWYHDTMLRLQVGGQFQRQNVLLLSAGGHHHGLGASLSRGVQVYASSTIRSARKHNVLGRDSEIAIAFTILRAQLDVEVELLTLTELAIIVFFRRGENLQQLDRACSLDILLNTTSTKG
jgi:hypothetical protein